jgi:hypothetical protein
MSHRNHASHVGVQDGILRDMRLWSRLKDAAGHHIPVPKTDVFLVLCEIPQRGHENGHAGWGSRLRAPYMHRGGRRSKALFRRMNLWLTPVMIGENQGGRESISQYVPRNEKKGSDQEGLSRSLPELAVQG